MGLLDTKIEWPTADRSNVLFLTVPLQQVRPARGAVVHQRWNENRTARETIRIGSGVYDIFCKIRYQNSPQGFEDMLIAGVEENDEMRYTHSDGSTHDFKIVEPTTIEEIPFDELQRTQDWHRLELRLRKTDGDRWDGVY